MNDLNIRPGMLTRGLATRKGKGPVERLDDLMIAPPIICGVHELESHQARRVTHVLSILDPETPDPVAFLGFGDHFRQRMNFSDDIEPGPGIVLPHRGNVADILAFGRTFDLDAGQRTDAGLLVHCWMGISRSTAAASMLLAQRHSEMPEEEVFALVLAARPQAWPNSLMVGYADEFLGRDGRLAAAVGRLYATRLEREPAMAAHMTGLNRRREVDLGMASRPFDAGQLARRAEASR